MYKIVRALYTLRTQDAILRQISHYVKNYCQTTAIILNNNYNEFRLQNGYILSFFILFRRINITIFIQNYSEFLEHFHLTKKNNYALIIIISGDGKK